MATKNMEGNWKVFFWAACFAIIFSMSDAKKVKREDEDNSMDKILNDPSHPDYISANWHNTDVKIAQGVEQMMKKLMPMVIRSSSSVDLSGPCMASLFKMMLGLRQSKTWAFKVIDSWGKPGDGLFEGNFGYVGDYDECVNQVIPELKDQEGNPQKGLYCLVRFTPILPPKPQLYTLFHKIPELANITNQNTSFAETAKNAHWFYLLGLRMGVCVPNSCTADDVHSILDQIPKQLSVKGTLTVQNCETKQYFTVNNDQIAI
ncbi:Nose resistant to fluoxetine protein 6, partial [Stegodyphus mimosarum]